MTPTLSKVLSLLSWQLPSASGLAISNSCRSIAESDGAHREIVSPLAGPRTRLSGKMLLFFLRHILSLKPEDSSTTITHHYGRRASCGIENRQSFREILYYFKRGPEITRPAFCYNFFIPFHLYSFFFSQGKVAAAVGRELKSILVDLQHFFFIFLQFSAKVSGFKSPF